VQPVGEIQKFHVVVKGETLGGIAKKANLSTLQLLALNPQKQANPNLIVVGENPDRVNGAGGCFTAAVRSSAQSISCGRRHRRRAAAPTERRRRRGPGAAARRVCPASSSWQDFGFGKLNRFR
jgi:LysM domain